MSAHDTWFDTLPHRNLLEGRFVFLSASFPSKSREPRFYESAIPNEITQAVIAMVRAVLSAKGRLVFGGHPTVSPLVLMVAEDYVPPDIDSRLDLRAQKQSPVLVYQSRIYENVISAATTKLFDWGLADLVWTEAVTGETMETGSEPTPVRAEESLRRMREEMLKATEPVGAVFIGGMEGIKEEADLFGRLVSKTAMYFIGGPGGAARELGFEYPTLLSPDSRLVREELADSRSYPALMQRIVLDMASRA